MLNMIKQKNIIQISFTRIYAVNE